MISKEEFLLMSEHRKWEMFEICAKWEDLYRKQKASYEKLLQAVEDHINKQ